MSADAVTVAPGGPGSRRPRPDRRAPQPAAAAAPDTDGGLRAGSGRRARLAPARERPARRGGKEDDAREKGGGRAQQALKGDARARGCRGGVSCAPEARRESEAQVWTPCRAAGWLAGRARALRKPAAPGGNLRAVPGSWTGPAQTWALAPAPSAGTALLRAPAPGTERTLGSPAKPRPRSSHSLGRAGRGARASARPVRLLGTGEAPLGRQASGRRALRTCVRPARGSVAASASLPSLGPRTGVFGCVVPGARWDSRRSGRGTSPDVDWREIQEEGGISNPFLSSEHLILKPDLEAPAKTPQECGCKAPRRPASPPGTGERRFLRSGRPAQSQPRGGSVQPSQKVPSPTAGTLEAAGCRVLEAWAARLASSWELCPPVPR
nr:skin secretory protein xP2 [Oryctolagus cuniculus]